MQIQKVRAAVGRERLATQIPAPAACRSSFGSREGQAHEIALAAALAVACLAAQAGPKAPAYYDQNGKLFGVSVPNQGIVLALLHLPAADVAVALSPDTVAGGMVPDDGQPIHFATPDCSGVAYLQEPFLSGARSALWSRTASGEVVFVADSMKAVDGLANVQSYSVSAACHADVAQLQGVFASSAPPVKVTQFVWPLVLHRGEMMRSMQSAHGATAAEVTPGKAVTFATAPGAGPVFRLTYQAESPQLLKVTFGMVPPGQTEFRVIATGSLRRR